MVKFAPPLTVMLLLKVEAPSTFRPESRSASLTTFSVLFSVAAPTTPSVPTTLVLLAASRIMPCVP